MKLFIKTYSAEEVLKDKYIVDLEVVSLDNNNNILPNAEFVIKANEVSKKRMTKNDGVYRDNEIFESKSKIEKIFLYDINENLISEYPVIINYKTENLSDLSLLYIEICELINSLDYDNDTKEIRNNQKTITMDGIEYECSDKKNNGVLNIIESKTLYYSINFIEITESNINIPTISILTSLTSTFSIDLKKNFSLSKVGHNISDLFMHNDYYGFKVFGLFEVIIEAKQILKNEKSTITKQSVKNIIFIDNSRKKIKKLRKLLKRIKQST